MKVGKRKAELIQEGCILRERIRECEERLKEIKTELNFTRPGTYEGHAGSEVVVAETEKFSDISPRDVLDYLKRKGMSNRFPETVKVQITPLRKIVPESMINKWRHKLDSIMRYTWK